MGPNARERPFDAEDLSEARCPVLTGIRIALVTKARDPDPTFRGRGAFGIHALNSPPETKDYSRTFGAPPRFRRRIQTVTIALRNFGTAR